MDLYELIRSINIVEYIGQFTELEKRGDEWWGLSPLKNEKTPSFSVREDPPFWYDYSSGGSGNLFSFIKAYFKCSNKEAVQIMKDYAGVEGSLTPSGQRLSAISVMKRYSASNHRSKASSGIILPDDYMEKYERRIDKMAVWVDEGISVDVLDKFQVRYDAFSDRLVYPIRNLDGKIVNVGGRTLDPGWKDKKLRKYTYFFSWGTIDTIFGAAEHKNEIGAAREIIIFEGCKSVLLAETWGVYNTGAILTSHLSTNQMKLLAKLGCTVTFMLDKEIPIKEDKNIQKLRKYVNVYYFWDKSNLLDSKDAPVDKGEEVFRRLYNARLRFR